MATLPTGQPVEEFLAQVEPTRRRRDALALVEIFREVTGHEPVMWGPTMVGFDSYHYIYDSGREGDALATGFSPRSANLALYVLDGHPDEGPLLERLGKHKAGRACLYVNKLDDVDLKVLREIAEKSYRRLRDTWPERARV